LPREDVVRLGDQPEYGPGKVIDTIA
jgi:hypothetical protein